MDLRNCKKCGRVFAYTDSDLCSRCDNGGEEDNFKKVKEYLYDHPGATITEVCEETGVNEKLILKYLRENRIEIREEDNMVLDCERCGKAIRSGRFCDDCAAKLKKEFSQVLRSEKKEEEYKKPKGTKRSERMYIAERRKERQ